MNIFCDGAVGGRSCIGHDCPCIERFRGYKFACHGVVGSNFPLGKDLDVRLQI